MYLTDVQYLGQETIVKKCDSFAINPEGEISVLSNFNGGKSIIELGTLLFTNPANSSDLNYLRSGYFASENKWRSSDFGSISEVVGGTVVQGSLERSNVDLLKQLSDLIQSQVVFNSNSKAIQAYTEAYKLVENIR
jgi:flagellar basal-body rod protein FlgG